MRTLPLAAAAALLLTLPAAAGAAAKDRNADGIPDSWEKRHKLALVAGQDEKDQDRDGLENLVEWQAGTNPRRRDSDRDGRPDGREDGDRDGLRNRFEGATGHDAGDPDTDGDDVRDGDEGAGRVLGVSGTTVTIDLGTGRKARATVTDETFSRCGAPDEWLDGLFDIATEDEPADEEEPAADEPVEDLVEGLLPALRTADGEDEADEPDPADGTEEGEEPDATDVEGACPDGAVRKGTWIHASDTAEGAFTWLDVVLADDAE